MFLQEEQTSGSVRPLIGGKYREPVNQVMTGVRRVSQPTTKGDEDCDTAGTRKGRLASCPECDRHAFALIPADAHIAVREACADGEVWFDCYSCEHRFLEFVELEQ